MTVSNLLSSLFVENQTTNIDYSKYFQQCLPVSCTYTSTDRTDFSYTITLFVSLYGGLIIILRLLAPFLTLILFEPRRYFRTTQWKLGFVHSMQRVNLFKKAAERSARSIRQQKLTTWVYLLFLTGSPSPAPFHCLFLTPSAVSIATHSAALLHAEHANDDRRRR